MFNVHLQQTVIYSMKAMIFSILLLSAACTTKRHGQVTVTNTYIPESKELYDAIVTMDSTWGHAYNNCQIGKMDSLISEDLEFYHDKSGLSTSKESTMTSYKNNVCGRVTRELLKGSIEVYAIQNFGAVQMGRHRFYTSEEEKKNNQRYSKFIHIWKNMNGQWKITRVISLH